MIPMPLPPQQPYWPIYAFALAATLVVLLVRVQLIPMPAHRPLLILFVLPITISAALGGLGPGLVATLVAAVGADLLILEPVGSLVIAHPMDAVQLGILVSAGMLVSLLSEWLHRARRQAHEGRSQVACGLLLRVLSERLRRTQRELTEVRLLQSAILADIRDGVITTDRQGRVNWLNIQAERLTGWSEADAAGRPLAEVLRVIHEETRVPAADPAQQVLTAGAHVGLAEDALLIARDSGELHIRGRGLPVRSGEGALQGVVLVFRDH